MEFLKNQPGKDWPRILSCPYKQGKTSLPSSVTHSTLVSSIIFIHTNRRRNIRYWPHLFQCRIGRNFLSEGRHACLPNSQSMGPKEGTRHCPHQRSSRAQNYRDHEVWTVLDMVLAIYPTIMDHALGCERCLVSDKSICFLAASVADTIENEARWKPLFLCGTFYSSAFLFVWLINHTMSLKYSAHVMSNHVMESLY